MKRTVLVVLAAVALMAGSALPSEARVHGEIFIGPVWGPGWWGPPYYSYPYYPPAPPVVIQQQPQEYIYQRTPQSEPQQYWYYCTESKAYYPYVKRCPGGWMKVVPTPAPAPKPAAPDDKE